MKTNKKRKFSICIEKSSTDDYLYKEFDFTENDYEKWLDNDGCGGEVEIDFFENMEDKYQTSLDCGGSDMTKHINPTVGYIAVDIEEDDNKTLSKLFNDIVDFYENNV